MTKRKPDDKAAPTPGTLVTPAHGRGALRYGAQPGTNAGGTGRPASELRARLRGSLADRTAIIEEIADDGEQSAADRLKAIDLMAKYGLGANKGHDEALVAQLARVTAEVFAGDERLGELHERWVKVIGAHVRGAE